MTGYPHGLLIFRRQVVCFLYLPLSTVNSAKQFHRWLEKRIQRQRLLQFMRGFRGAIHSQQRAGQIHMIGSVAGLQQDNFFKTSQRFRWLLALQQDSAKAREYRRIIWKSVLQFVQQAIATNHFGGGLILQPDSNQC